MSGNIITASNLVVAGNIAVGGFLVQGTSISQGNVNVGSITISGVELQVDVYDEGVKLNFSGDSLLGLTVCGAPIGGWVGTATTDLNMDGKQILNVERLEFNEQAAIQVVAPSSTQIIFTNICDDTGGNRITILPSDNFIGIGQPTPNAGECIHAVPPVIFEGSLAVGTPTLSGALNVLGDVYVEGSVYTSSQSLYVGGIKISQSEAGIDFGTAHFVTLSETKQPFIQYGNGSIFDGSASVTLTKAYSNDQYTVIASVYAINNSGFFLEKTAPDAFRIQANDLTEAWDFGWTTLGNL